MSESRKGLNDLGEPALSHYDLRRCSLNAPGDWSVDEVKDVDCPECLESFEQLRKRQREAREGGKPWWKMAIGLGL
jgi:hypothetical protein